MHTLRFFLHVTTFTKITTADYTRPRQPLNNRSSCVFTQGTFTVELAAKTACLHLDKRTENIHNIENVCM